MTECRRGFNEPVAIHTTGDYPECHWGVIKHPCPLPGLIGPLMLATPSFVAKLMREPQEDNWVTVDGRRMFAHVRYDQTWTWELFPAYFADGKGPSIFIGRWPD